MGEGRLQADAGVDRCLGDQADDDDRVRRGDEGLRPHQGAVPQVGGRGDCALQVQRALIGRNGAGVIVDMERPEGQIVLAVMPLESVLQPFRRRVILSLQGFPNGPQGLRSFSGQARGHQVGMLRPLVRLTGPEGDVVEGDVFVYRIPVDQGAQASVAQGQRLFEVGGGPVVMQGKGTFGSGRAGRCKQQDGKKDVFHGVTRVLDPKIAFFGQKSNSSKTGLSKMRGFI